MLDLSQFDQNAMINLNPGTFRSAGGKINNIGVAFSTVIDKAIGGRGDDVIIASNVSSQLEGRDGSDVLWGGASDDTLVGGDDPDTFHPGGGLNSCATRWPTWTATPSSTSARARRSTSPAC